MVDYIDTEQQTLTVIERMQDSLASLEQMSFDAINITDKLVSGIDEIRERVMGMREAGGEEQEQAIEAILKLLQELLSTAFMVNNVSHELDREAAYQHDTVGSIRQIVDFLYAMSGDVM